MKRSRLKCKASMTKNPIDIKNYMKERNVAVKLNRQSKSEYFEKVSICKTSKSFWDTCKPYFSNKHAKLNSKIMLVKGEKVSIKRMRLRKGLANTLKKSSMILTPINFLPAQWKIFLMK